MDFPGDIYLALVGRQMLIISNILGLIHSMQDFRNLYLILKYVFGTIILSPTCHII